MSTIERVFESIARLDDKHKKQALTIAAKALCDIVDCKKHDLAEYCKEVDDIAIVALVEIETL